MKPYREGATVHLIIEIMLARSIVVVVVVVVVVTPLLPLPPKITTTEDSTRTS